MAFKFLKVDSLPAFLAALAKDARVVAPVKTDGVVQFQPWTAGDAVELDVLLAKQSPKEWFFPQSETYLKFVYGKEAAASSATGANESAAESGADAPIPLPTVNLEPQNDAPNQVIFGLRPCDARGLTQMDQVFGGYGGFYYDPLYNARRAATTVLAVACAKPRSTCFCTALGGSPAGTEGVDVLFTPVEGGFLVEGLTDQGKALLDVAPGMAAANDTQSKAAAAVKAQAEAAVDKPFELEGIRDHLHDNIADPGWHDLCMRCISCGTCTYVCPNCYCFGINDEIVESSGERYRVWDNCFNPTYTEETSGHNPRAQKSNRFRNRFSHKFWYYPDKYDSLLCSGCGRCIMHCPTRIDIREVLTVMGAPAGVDATGGAAADAAAAAKGKGA
jgi:sulfhydrogenase subunit beta (sulfur reductase)